jgi:crossover junction endodeoxyribonuclease RusA
MCRCDRTDRSSLGIAPTRPRIEARRHVDSAVSFECAVPGTPVSQRAENRFSLSTWKHTVADHAAQALPTHQDLSTSAAGLTVVYYYDLLPRLDLDNMIKPIMDALSGIVYADDKQVKAIDARFVDLNGAFRVRGLSPVLAAAFSVGSPFVHLVVSEPPDPQELPR